MRPVVGLSANTLSYPQGGGHMWVYLNWALGLRDAGCDVVWLEGVRRENARDHAEDAGSRIRCPSGQGKVPARR